MEVVHTFVWIFYFRSALFILFYEIHSVSIIWLLLLIAHFVSIVNRWSIYVMRSFNMFCQLIFSIVANTAELTTKESNQINIIDFTFVYNVCGGGLSCFLRYWTFSCRLRMCKASPLSVNACESQDSTCQKNIFGNFGEGIGKLIRGVSSCNGFAKSIFCWSSCHTPHRQISCLQVYSSPL